MSHAKETLTLNTALQSEPVKPEITPTGFIASNG
jgi:hypothetical protein